MYYAIYFLFQSITPDELWMFRFIFHCVFKTQDFRDKNVYKRTFKMSMDAFAGKNSDNIIDN